MVLGRIQPIGLRTPFWLPDGVRPQDLGLALSVQSVEAAGGRVIGDATTPFFFARNLPASMLCKKCSFLITKL